ncbi:MAG: hypothetical protein IBX53_02395 [Halomonas sp.]|nr:hypothetical protein [Halomonas sp.]MBE0487903.1 hypothetical protein [Halomonas sp.]
MKHKMVKSTPLTHFQRHASDEQKQALRAKVISNAIARQKRVLEAAKEGC